MDIKISINSNGTNAPLYFTLPGIASPQRAYIEYSGKFNDNLILLEADFCGELGSVPMDVWLGIRRRWLLHPAVLLSEIQALETNKYFIELVNRVNAGYSLQWQNGSRRGFLTPDALQAEIQIEQYLTHRERAEIWDADEWCADGTTINELVKYGSVEKLGQALLNVADDKQVVIGDCARAAANHIYFQIERFFQFPYPDCLYIKEAIDLLVQYDSAAYASLLDKYAETFGNVTWRIVHGY